MIFDLAETRVARLILRTLCLQPKLSPELWSRWGQTSTEADQPSVVRRPVLSACSLTLHCKVDKVLTCPASQRKQSRSKAFCGLREVKQSYHQSLCYLWLCLNLNLPTVFCRWWGFSLWGLPFQYYVWPTASFIMLLSNQTLQCSVPNKHTITCV